MAIDTRNRRASAVGAMLPFMGCLPLADGTIDTADRRQLSACYAGLDATPVELSIYPNPFLARSTVVVGRADPFLATSAVPSTRVDPFLATSRYKGNTS